MGDQLLCGMEKIALLVGWTRQTLSKRLPELQAAGVVFEMKHGKPPRKTWCAWESGVKIWTAEKARKNESL